MTSVTGAGRRIGLLGGTFDPPHIGHLVAAVEVRHRLDLDVVLLVPAGDPWQKSATRSVSPAAVRLEMVEAAVAGIRGVEASDIEVRRAGPSYTVDTVAEMRAAEPGLGISLILGREAAAGLATWERPEELLAQVELVVVDRPSGSAVAPLDRAAREVHVPQIEVSSTDLRRRVRAGEPIDVLVPEAVASLIARHDLYRP